MENNCAPQLLSSTSEALWDWEYTVGHTLPSTDNYRPSRCLAYLSDVFQVGPGVHVLDLGCGNGRHSAYFASLGCDVHALDVSTRALQLARAHMDGEGHSARVKFFHQSALDTLPHPEGGFEIVLDSYMSCHVVALDDRAKLRRRVADVLAPRGVFISLGVARGDSYYKQYTHADADHPALVRDPNSGIIKLLLTRDYITNEVRDFFQVERVGVLRMSDIICGRSFDKEAVYVGARLGI